MLFALNLFGFDICQVYLGPQPQAVEDEEYISNTTTELDLPFGFGSALTEVDDEEYA